MNTIIVKKFKLKKNKNQLKDNNIVFFFHSINLDCIKKLKLDQNIKNKRFKLFKVKNSLLKIIFNNSIFSNQSRLIKGSLCFLCQDTNNFIDIKFKNILKIDKNLTLMAIKLNNKIYSINQLKTFNTLTYLGNLKLLNKTLNKFFKKPFKIL